MQIIVAECTLLSRDADRFTQIVETNTEGNPRRPRSSSSGGQSREMIGDEFERMQRSLNAFVV